MFCFPCENGRENTSLSADLISLFSGHLAVKSPNSVVLGAFFHSKQPVRVVDFLTVINQSMNVN
jgi:hypothetical protein